MNISLRYVEMAFKVLNMEAGDKSPCKAMEDKTIILVYEKSKTVNKRGCV